MSQFVVPAWPRPQTATLLRLRWDRPEEAHGCRATGSSSTPPHAVTASPMDTIAGYGFWAATEKESARFLEWFHFRPGEGAGFWSPCSDIGSTDGRGTRATRRRVRVR